MRLTPLLFTPLLPAIEMPPETFVLESRRAYGQHLFYDDSMGHYDITMPTASHYDDDYATMPPPVITPTDEPASFTMKAACQQKLTLRGRRHDEAADSLHMAI